jgi:hypothetical protein
VVKVFNILIAALDIPDLILLPVSLIYGFVNKGNDYICGVKLRE